jgi:WD40 repeat protein
MVAAYSADSPAGPIVATASECCDGIVTLWDVSDPAQPRRTSAEFVGGPAPCCAFGFSPDGTILAIGTASADVPFVDQNSLFLWDVTDPARPLRLAGPVPDSSPLLGPITFSPDGHTLLTSLGTLWDVSNRSAPRILRTLQARVDAEQAGQLTFPSTAELRPDGKVIAAGWGDGRVGIYLTDQPDRPPTLLDGGHSAVVDMVAFSPDGNTLASGSDSSVILWDVTDLTAPHQVGGTLSARAGLAFADGRTLATGSGDGSIVLWDLTDREHPVPIGYPLDGSGGRPNPVAFSVDGARLLSTSQNPYAILWPVGGLLAERDAMRDNPSERACERVGWGLTPEEWTQYVPGVSFRATCDA